MKLGIITPYDSANFGAYLQAYANMQYLRSIGHEVCFIKFRSDEQRKKAFYPQKKSIKAQLRQKLRKRHADANYEVMTEALTCFNIVEQKDTCCEGLDGVIIGSDEVWNVNVKTFRNPIFYGIDKIPSFAYAPSMGNADKGDFDSYPELAEKLKKVHIIGVRDYNTQSIVGEICGEMPDIVCDPTCLLDVSEYPISSQRIVKEKYMLVYAYSVPVELRKKIKRYAKQRGLKLIAVCMDQSWCDQIIHCTPLEFCSLIHYAECVFTTTFHGTIFTLMQHKKCAVYAVSKKLRDLLLWTKMDAVKIDNEIEYETLANLLNTKPDYTAYEKYMKERREASKERYQACLREVYGTDMQ